MCTMWVGRCIHPVFNEKSEKKWNFFEFTPCKCSWKFYNWRRSWETRPKRRNESRERREKRKPARLSGRLKESEICLVTAQEKFLEVYLRKTGQTIYKINEEFDPGSERTLVACLIHASRARQQCRAANGWVTRKQSAPYQEIPVPTRG